MWRRIFCPGQMRVRGFIRWTQIAETIRRFPKNFPDIWNASLPLRKILMEPLIRRSENWSGCGISEGRISGFPEKMKFRKRWRIPDTKRFPWMEIWFIWTRAVLWISELPERESGLIPSWNIWKRRKKSLRRLWIWEEAVSWLMEASRMVLPGMWQWQIPELKMRMTILVWLP